MSKKGQTYNAPKKTLHIPADVKPLQRYGNFIVQSIAASVRKQNNKRG